jgi:FAD/FMN-containing dehydrogenase/Fe-S oxidoreductase
MGRSGHPSPDLSAAAPPARQTLAPTRYPPLVAQQRPYPDPFAPIPAPTLPPPPSEAARRESLVAALRAKVRGQVQFGPADRVLYATDASNYRQVPIGVIRPLDSPDLVEAVRICHEHDFPVTPRGAGTSIAGQAINRAVVIDTSRHLNRILAIDPKRRTARVQPGVILDHLRVAAAEHGLTFGPDPATHDRCTIGGMIGNDSCGAHSVMAGRTSDNIEWLDVLTYSGLRMIVSSATEPELNRMLEDPSERGEIYRALVGLRNRHADLIRDRYPRIPRLVSGYALNALLPERNFDVARALIGAEGTCVFVVEATVRLVAEPSARALAVMGFRDVFAAADRTPEIMAVGPIGLEGFDDRLVEACRRKDLNLAAIERLPKAGGWLLVEFAGETIEDAAAKAERAIRRFGTGRGTRHAIVVSDPAEQQAMWKLRESAVGAMAQAPGRPPTYPGWEDSAVPRERLGAYMRELRQLLDFFGYDYTLYGHFGDACLHMRTDFDFRSETGRRHFRSFMEQAADLVARYGGSLSGEHGDGQARGELLARMYGPELVEVFREFKTIWDPRGRMNPGKLVDPLPLDSDLRATLTPAEVPTVFGYREDAGSLATAVGRCVGVGLCRREEGGAMCPSFMATREERHSTRGRAHLLWEMLLGETVEGLWRNEEVREALELCLSCKACKSDCPLGVDMATYRAEFMAAHYVRRRRPRTAYTMGMIHRWAYWAQVAPFFVNAVAGWPLISRLTKLAVGVDSHRRIPRFASRTFRNQLPREMPDIGGARDAKRRVVLFADTITEAFAPSQGLAALRVLRAAGYEVEVPQAHLCCGRPLYEHGFLDLARQLLGQVLDAFEPELDSGVPVVVLEPSCLSVFQDELVDLFPSDPRAKRFSEMVTGLPELMQARPRHFGRVTRPRLDSVAVLHGHCHQKALIGMAAEEAVLRSIGLEPEQPEPGCCGMAGAFGYERGERYRVSQAIGEALLLPAVRSAPKEAILVADGFSCREQIRQGTKRKALHLAEVLTLAMDTPPRAGETPDQPNGPEDEEAEEAG